MYYKLLILINLLILPCLAVPAFSQTVVTENIPSTGPRYRIEAKLIHITLDDQHQDGVDWSGILEDYQTFRLTGKYDFLGNRTKDPALSLGTITESDLGPLIEALDTVGIVREFPIVNAVTPLTRPVCLSVRFDNPAIALSPAENDTPAVPGSPVMEIMLSGLIDVDGTVRTDVQPREPASGMKPTSEPAALLTRNPRMAQVRSLDNGTIVIGGLLVSENVPTLRKVPLVGDLPLLGSAFRYHNSAIQREEFVVLLTRRAVPSEEGGAGQDRPGK